jgi:hypothetical protein
MKQQPDSANSANERAVSVQVADSGQIVRAITPDEESRINRYMVFLMMRHPSAEVRAAVADALYVAAAEDGLHLDQLPARWQEFVRAEG